MSFFDDTQFVATPFEVAGEEVVLIRPKEEGTDWTEDNLHFRSSMWLDDRGVYRPVSLGYKKFFNWDERPTVTPQPKSIEGLNILEKVDGSCLIVSSFKGELITRTRKTLTKFHTNGAEVDVVISMYPEISNYLHKNEDVTLLFEWVTPTNRIVINYGELDVILTGAVRHADYSYFRQDELDVLAKKLNVRRPKRYTFSSIEDMLKLISTWTDLEGCCAYYNDDQAIRKLKCDWYLRWHNILNGISIRRVTLLFIELGFPSREEFERELLNQFEYEGFQSIEYYLDTLYGIYREALELIGQITEFTRDYTGTKAEIAAQVKADPRLTSGLHRALAFNALNQTTIRPTVWKTLLKIKN